MYWWMREMPEMIIRPRRNAGMQVIYADGKFSDNDTYVINQAGGTTPLGGLLCCPGSDYSVAATPAGMEASRLGKTVLTAVKAWYIKDMESGKAWSAFYNPVCSGTDEYEIRFAPGKIQAYSLKDKIACTLTITISPGQPCEVWHVKLENHSAQDRSIRFVTCVEPAVIAPLETIYLEQEKTILMRRPLESIERVRPGDNAPNLVFFHSSTLPANTLPIEKSEFIGQDRTYADPIALDMETIETQDGIAIRPVAGLSVNIDVPIEGEAEFGFCFGAAQNADEAAEIARSFNKVDAVSDALVSSQEYWNKLTSSMKVETQDKVLDALINTWLPYEAYTGYIKQFVETGTHDPACQIMRYLPLGANAAYLFRQALVNFAGRLSVSGTYHPDEFSQIDMSTDDLLSLAICTAAYVTETGNIGILSQTVAFKDGIVMSLGEHCERAIRKCANSPLESEKAYEALEQALRLWSFIKPNDEFTALLEKVSNRQPFEPDVLPEERALPRRVKYLQSVCPTLAEINNSLQIDSSAPDTKTMLDVYSYIVEDILGITVTYEGMAIKPNLPESWFECMVTRRFRGDTYNIYIKRSATKTQKGISMIVDGEPVLGDMLPFFADGCEHEVEVNVG